MKMYVKKILCTSVNEVAELSSPVPDALWFGNSAYTDSWDILGPCVEGQDKSFIVQH